MSRHALTSKNPNYAVTVGWDFPLQTFFVDVRKRNPAPGDKAGVISPIWVGGVPGEVTDPRRMVAVIAEFADLNEDMIAILLADQAADAARAPTTLQRMMLNLVGAGKTAQV